MALRNWEYVDNELLNDWLETMLEEPLPPFASGEPAPPLVSKSLVELGFNICIHLGVEGEVKYLAIHILERFINIMTAKDKKRDLIKILNADTYQWEESEGVVDQAPCNEKTIDDKNCDISNNVNENLKNGKERNTGELELSVASLVDNVETDSIKTKKKLSHPMTTIHGIGMKILIGVCAMLASKYLLEPNQQIRICTLAKQLSLLESRPSPPGTTFVNAELAILTTLDYRLPTTTAYSKLEILLLTLGRRIDIEDHSIVFDTSTVVLEEMFSSRWDILCAVFQETYQHRPSSADEMITLLKLDSDQLFLSSGIVISSAIILNLDWDQWSQQVADISGWPKDILVSCAKIIMNNLLTEEK